MFKNVEDDLAASPVVVTMVLVVVRLFDVFGSHRFNICIMIKRDI